MVDRPRQNPPTLLPIWVIVFILTCLLFGIGFAGVAIIAKNGLYKTTSGAIPVSATQSPIDVARSEATLLATMPTPLVIEGYGQTITPMLSPAASATFQLPTLTHPTPTLGAGLETTPLIPTYDAWVEDTLAAMTVEQKIGQMLMMGVEGKAANQQTCQQISDLQPGAIVYRTGNATNPTQLQRFSTDLQDCAQAAGLLPLWIAIDHEGQYVNRFEGGSTIFPAAMAQGATFDPAFAYQDALAAGQELAYSGVNMVLGPVADVLLDYDNTVISLRSFGGYPQQVSQFVSQAVTGYIQSGIAPVLKHFPGHGGVSADTHFETVSDPVDLQRLREAYLPPFQSGIQAGALVVMFGHVIYPTIDSTGLPATLSPTLVSLLRDELGFQGVILTDSMGMAAITGQSRSPGDAALQAVKAGVDMLLVSSYNTAKTSFDSIHQAVQQGTIPDERIDSSVRRILAIKATRNLKTFPVPQVGEPNWQANQNVAYETGYRSVALLKNEANLVPLTSESKHILIIGPDDGWGLYPVLGRALESAGHSYKVVTYPGPWSGPIPSQELLQSLPSQAAGYDMTLILTWDAHLSRLLNNDPWQVKLVQRILQATDDASLRVIVAALKSPTDLLEFPQVSTYLATFGTTDGQIQALADTLVGRWTPTGQSPLPGLP